ncbi:MAG: GNAT family N-acetyltransferase [Pseudomonadota bacterium]
MQVREVMERDLEHIMALYAQLHPDDPTVTDGRGVDVLATITAADGLFLFVGELDEAIVATCYLNVIPNLSRNASPYGIIENVITEQTMRKRGLGKKMIAHALNEAFNRGCYKVMLQTGSNRTSTHQFYRSCGFVGDDKHAYIARPPNRADADV